MSSMTGRSRHAASGDLVDAHPSPQPASAGRREILFIDSRVPDPPSLIDGTAPGIEVVLLDAQRGGIEQITEALNGRRGIEAIHLVSHGSPGRITLGGGSLDATALEDRAEALGRWGEALAPEGDIRVYGCEVAAGAPGEAFITTLAEATGAGVAASSTPTGAAARGGDWQLDRHSGEVASEPFLSLAQQRNWPGLLASSEFNWDSDTAKVNGSTVSETVAGVTLTISTSSSDGMGFDDIDDASNLEGQVAYDEYTGGADTYTFEFDQAIDMGTIELLTTTTSAGTTATFSAVGHDDVTSGGTIANVPDNASVVDLSDFTNIMSFTMTSATAEQFYFDEISFSTANAPPTTPVDTDDTSGGTIAENAANGTAVGITAEASDPDGDDANVSYTLTDDADGRFQIDADTGVVSVADGSRLDYETATSHMIGVQAMDEAGGVSTATFTVDVTDVNEAPTITSGGSAAADENQTAVTTVAASDPDAGDTLTYSLSGGADAGLFSLDAATGELAFASAPDFESPTDSNSDGVYDVQVTATDGSGATDTQDIAVTVGDVDEVPVFSATGPFSVSESAGNGTTLGDIQATDGDGGADDDNLTYAIVGGNTSGAFAIDTATGELRVADASAVDFDASPTFNLDIEADDGTNAPTANVTVNVTNAAPSTPIDVDGTDGGALMEDAADGFEVGITAEASDPGGGNVSYALTDDAGGRFQINAGTGVVSVANGSLIDYETATSHSITVQASDDDGADSGTATFTIDVYDVDEVPEFTSTGPFEVSEAAGNGSSVGDVHANDGDAGTPDDGVTYAITGGNDSGAFAIDHDNGVIEVADATQIDFENDETFTLTIEADDGAGTTTSPVIVNVTDAPPTPPTDTNASADTVAEDALNGAAVGVAVTAADPAGGDVTYALADDAGGRFAIDSATGDVTVADASLIDFEASASHTIEIEARDADGTASPTLSVDIAVTNVNEAPDITSDGGSDTATKSVAENQTAVTTVAASDPDAGDTATFSLSGGADASLFSIDDTTGELTFASAPDFEAPADSDGDGVYDVQVTAIDGGGATDTQDLAVAVTDVNDAPTITSGNDATADENQTTVTTVAASDPDAGDTTRFSIGGGADASLFSIDDTTGELTFASAPDFETPTDSDGDGIYDVQVTATDDDGATDSQAIAVAVTDVNEAPVIATNTGFSVQSGRTVTLTGDHLDEGDPDDEGDELTYTLDTLPTSGALLLNGSELQANDTFTQQDIDDGAIRFRSGSTVGQSRFDITLADGGEDGVGTASDTVTVDVTAPPPEPEPDPDPEPEPDLIDLIRDAQPDNIGEQLDHAGEWLDTLPDDTSLDIHARTPTAGNAPADTITLTGSRDSLDAFVIDATALPGGSRLRLEDIDFASIKGDIEIVGDAGDTVIVADDGAQSITPGDGDDTLYGGGGDDRLWGQDGHDALFGGIGDDLLHGGSGQDIASYEGNRDDYVISQEHSVITLARKGDADDTDTLVNIEAIRFADGEEAVEYGESLEWITGLYAQVLGRQADLDGVQYWARQQDDGMARAEIAMRFLDSEEAGHRLPQNEEVLDLLYSALLGREADAEGRAYWADRLDTGASIEEVVGGFMGSEEMQGHDLEAAQWDFIA